MKQIAIRKIWERKNPHQLIVSIPSGVGVKAGDYVAIYKVKYPR